MGGKLLNGQPLPPEGVPWEYHNLFVFILGLAMATWLIKVLYQLVYALALRRSLASARPLPLYGMSLYVDDLQLIIRQHFNQILRMRRTVAPRKASRYTISAHLKPESLESFEESGHLGIKFVVDALAPSAVRLYWGVSEAACQAFMQQHQAGPPEAAESISAAAQPLLSPSRRGGATALSSPQEVSPLEEGLRQGGSPMRGRGGQLELGGRHVFAAGSYAASSACVRLPEGLGQAYRTPFESTVNPDTLGFDLSKVFPEGSGGGTVPLVIAITAKARMAEEERPLKVDDTPVIEAHSQITLVKFVRDSSTSPMKAEVVQQVIFGADSAQRIMGIYGFEGEHQESEDLWDCQICYDQPKSVLLLPCRHCSVCELCLRSLRDERCPLCRATFSAYMLLPLLRQQPGPATPAEPGRSFAV